MNTYMLLYNDKINRIEATENQCFPVFCLTNPRGRPVQDQEANEISWISTLDQKIPNLPDDGKEIHSLKRLKHLHREKVLIGSKPRTQNH